MKLQVIEKLLKLRQFALEQEQLKLYERRTEESQATVDVERATWALRHGFEVGLLAQSTKQVDKVQRYVREAAVTQEVCERKLGLAHRAVMEQISLTVEAQQKKEMMEKLRVHALQRLRAERDATEMKLLDEVAQNLLKRTVEQEQ